MLSKKIATCSCFSVGENNNMLGNENGIRNDPISRRDVDACDNMLGKSKCDDQGTRTMRSSDPLSVDLQMIE